MKYRNRVAICAEVLEIAREGAIKTKIMYGTNLSSRYFEETLELLIGRGLLKFDKEHRIYMTTRKGRKFLKGYDEMIRLIPAINERTSERLNMKSLTIQPSLESPRNPIQIGVP